MMAYFCGLYISSGARTPDSMLCDLFGLKTFFSLSPSFFFFLNQMCACASPAVQTCPNLCVPSPEGPELSCHGDGTQVLQWLPRHL